MSEKSIDLEKTARKMFAGLAILVMCIAVLWAAVWLFLQLEPVLMPVIIAGIISYLLCKPVDFVQRFVKSRSGAVALVEGGLLTLIIIFGACTIAPLMKESAEVFSKREVYMEKSVELADSYLGNKVVSDAISYFYEESLQDAKKANVDADVLREMSQKETPREQLTVLLKQNSAYLMDKGKAIGRWGTHLMGQLPLWFSGALLVPFMVYYFLVNKEVIEKGWHRILPLEAGETRKKIKEIADDINASFVDFLRCQMMVSLIDAFLIFIGLWALGVKYSLLLAFAAALLGIIPYIGIFSACLPALVIAYVDKGGYGMMAVAVLFAFISICDNYMFQPIIVGNKLKMHDMTVMFSVLFWGYVLGGVSGMLLGVPLTAAIQSLYKHFHLGNQEKEI